ncbi:aspartyl-phosphate phosphatase Spo0E family protein [Bacillus timonensis]|uniref:aspartyl-phosphate phosphatase Spo0E family protein n=1 Tax=Bacillus timonensis TaxID=1033734 RepID=UPI0002883EEC|nr:aspartyl-phosphate phosphatase Spo0E family protein [Bacillus timonensis]
MIYDNIQANETNLTMEILNLRQVLSDSYDQNHPHNLEYIMLVNKLDSLLKEYYVDILVNLITVSRKNLLKITEQKGFQHQDTIMESQRLDELIIQYQRLQQL